MSKMYLVLYDSFVEYSSWHPENAYTNTPAGMGTGRIQALKMEPFTDPQLAADFAAKNDGFVVIPATVTATIEGGGE